MLWALEKRSNIMKKKTRQQLEDDVRQLTAYQEAFFSLRNGFEPIVLEAAPYRVELIGAERQSGGVIAEGSCVTWVDDWCARASQGCRQLQELASAVKRVNQSHACEAADHDHNSCYGH